MTTPAPEIHARKWAENVATALQIMARDERIDLEPHWRAVPIDKSELGTYDATRCYLLGFASDPSKGKAQPSIKLFVCTWGDDGKGPAKDHHYRVSCPDAPLTAPATNWFASTTPHAVAEGIRQNMLQKAREARAKLNAMVKQVSAEEPTPAAQETLTEYRWVTIKEATAILGVSHDTVRRRMRAGELSAKLEHSKFGETWMVKVAVSPVAAQENRETLAEAQQDALNAAERCERAVAAYDESAKRADRASVKAWDDGDIAKARRHSEREILYREQALAQRRMATFWRQRMCEEAAAASDYTVKLTEKGRQLVEAGRDIDKEASFMPPHPKAQP